MKHEDDSRNLAQKACGWYLYSSNYYKQTWSLIRPWPGDSTHS